MSDTTANTPSKVKARLVAWLTEAIPGPVVKHVIKVTTESGAVYTIRRTPAPCEHLRETIKVKFGSDKPTALEFGLQACEARVSRDGSPVFIDEGADDNDYVMVGLVRIGETYHLFIKWANHARVSTPVVGASMTDADQA